MTHVTRASLAYVATQVCGLCLATPLPLTLMFTHCGQCWVRFGLSAASVFSRTDTETDSETFYTTVLELLEEPEEQDEVKELLAWWNQ